jgi:hypothetical protein
MDHWLNELGTTAGPRTAGANAAGSGSEASNKGEKMHDNTINCLQGIFVKRMSAFDFSAKDQCMVVWDPASPLPPAPVVWLADPDLTGQKHELYSLNAAKTVLLLHVVNCPWRARGQKGKDFFFKLDRPYEIKLGQVVTVTNKNKEATLEPGCMGMLRNLTLEASRAEKDHNKQ